MSDNIQQVVGYLRKFFEFPIFTLGSKPLTLLSILNLVLLLVVVFIAARFFRNFVLATVLKRTRLAPSMQYAIGKIAGYLIIGLGAYVALDAVGINLGALAVVAGAIGVGIGFGLQNVISNFISGIILLAERPITIGDRVEVGGVIGLVNQINLRSTTVTTNDNMSIIVPNSNFLTNAVINWSHGDPKVRIRLPFGVAYGTDLDKLQRVILAMALAHPKVLKDPKPALLFTSFGDNALNFELAVWTIEAIASPLGFQSDLNFGMEKIFRENQIEIPFPQRDLHVRSGSVLLQAGDLGTVQSIKAA